MSWRRFRYRMILKPVGEKRPAAIQPAQTSGELRLEASQIVGAHRGDCYEENEFRRRCICRLRARSRRPQREQENEGCEVLDSTIHVCLNGGWSTYTELARQPADR